MELNTSQLNAFYSVAKTLSFSKSAQVLSLSQPALSIRIKNLEEALGTSLFIRRGGSLQLTDAGQKLLAHTQLRRDIESEFLSEMNAPKLKSSSLQGLVRIAGFSTVVNSVLIPSLNGLVQEHPGIQFEIMTREMIELKTSLQRAEADFVIHEGPLVAANIEAIEVGYEENVIVEAKSIKPEKKSVYIDNDPDDLATIEFFRQQKNAPRVFQRWYLDTASTLMEAVELGWGRAVHPMHIIAQNKRIRVVTDFRPVQSRVFLNYYKQPYYSRLHLTVRDRLISKFRSRLKTYV